ncbi:MAG TPA: hydroxymethylbilane synthase [Burkholderiales bacterium]
MPEVGTRAEAPGRIVIASRESALALWQARYIESKLAASYPRAEIRILGLTTEGDRRLDASLARIGGKGLFVKELEEALASGRADIAVHSVKDLPMTLAREFALAAVSEREDPRDALVSNRYADFSAMPAGSRVGTSSLRRECQLRARYPGLRLEPLRGNVTTRLRKLDAGDYDAVILAAAGLKRLGLDDRITRLLPPSESIPAPGQGALGVECLSRRTDLLEALAALDHAATARCVAAERAFSRALSGSCNVPLGAYAEAEGANLRLRGFVGAPDGSRLVSGELTGPARDPEALGVTLAQGLKAQGAGDILAKLESQAAAR